MAEWLTHSSVTVLDLQKCQYVITKQEVSYLLHLSGINKNEEVQRNVYEVKYHSMYTEVTNIMKCFLSALTAEADA
jgi:hypothetical protein